jgi:antitoxin component YwqK of YwqJK toxin-antitoxin module
VYPDGRVERDGNEKVYYPDGTLKWEREYDHDSPSGSWNSYHRDGSRRSEYTYAGPTVETTMSFYDQSGQLVARGSARDAVRTGPWVFWYPDGASRQEGHYRVGRRVGVWTTRHANGGLESRGYYRDDARAGRWKHWPAEPPTLESDWQPEVPAEDWGTLGVEAGARGGDADEGSGSPDPGDLREPQ